MRDYGSSLPEYRRLGSLSTVDEISGNEELRDRIVREGVLPVSIQALVALGQLAEAMDKDAAALDAICDRRLKEIDKVSTENQRAIRSAYDAEVSDSDGRLKQDRAEVAEEERRLQKRLQTAKDELQTARNRGEQARADQAVRRIALLEGMLQELPKAEQEAASRANERRSKARTKLNQQESENKQKCGEAQEECQKIHDTMWQTLVQNVRGPVEGLVPDAAYRAALGIESGMRLNLDRLGMRDVEGYEAPPWFLLGSAYLPVPSGMAAGAQSVFGSVTDAAVGAAGDDRAVRMPLLADLSEGLQLVLKPSGGDEDATRAILRSLALRLLLAYPPTTLNVALIDPMRNGGTFSGLRSVVDIAHDTILPEIVVNQSNVRERLEALRLRMAQHLGNYSSPKEDGFFSHQAVQAIIINDFPCGFDKTSLSELAQIMVSGAGLGTIVILSVNDEYAREFDKNADYRAIVDSPQALRLAGDGNLFSLEGTRLSVSVGEVEEVERAEDEVLRALQDGICSSTGRVLTFSTMFERVGDVNAWRRESSANGLSIPIGISGGTRRACVNLGQPSVNAAHHGLIAGPTGAGKSVLMHTMITSALLTYSAEELQLVLIDFKEGVEFDRYVSLDLPSIRSVTVTTEPELALAALRDVKREWDRRSALGMDDYGRWRREHPGEFMPRILIIFDEVQELAGNHVPAEIRDECQGIFEHLAQQGRSHGIHLFLASQTFGGRLTESLDRNMRCRIALAQDTGILEDDVALAQRQNGAAIINERGGDETANQLVQVALARESEALELLGRLEEIYADPMLRVRFPDLDTRLYYSRIDSNPRLPHNRLIAGEAPARHEAGFPQLVLGQTLYESWVQDGYERTGEECSVPLEQNLLLVGRNFTTAEASAVNLALALSLDDVSRRTGGLPASDGVTIATFARERSAPVDPATAPKMPTSLSDLDQLPCVRRVSGLPRDRDFATGLTPFESALNELHALLEERRATGYDGRDCRVLVIYGLESAHGVLRANVQALGGAGEKSPLEKVQDLVIDGPSLGIQVIVWAQQEGTVAEVLGAGLRGVSSEHFALRLVFSASKEELAKLTNDEAAPLTAGAQALYSLMDNERLFVRPFTPPRVSWLEQFSAACERARDERERQQVPVSW